MNNDSWIGSLVNKYLTSRETKNEEQEIKSDFSIDCQIQIQ